MSVTTKRSLSESSMECLSLDFGPFEAINCWKKMPECDKFVGAPRSKHTVVTYKDAVYVFGGDNGNQMLNDLLRFDVKEKSWTNINKTGAPSPRYHHSSVVFNSSMFVFGGYTGDILCNSNLTNRNDLWEFKFDTTQWVEWKTPSGTSRPVPRSAHGTAVHNGFLYIFAGYDGNARLKDMWRINLNISSSHQAKDQQLQPSFPTPSVANQQNQHQLIRRWEQVHFVGDSPPACCNFPVAVSRDSMFVFSGESGAKATNSLFQFHFESQTWNRINTEHVLRDIPNPPIRRYGHSMVNFNSHLYVFGGAADNILPNELHCFDLDDETWSTITPTSKNCVPIGRLFHAATIVGDAMYVFGGTIDNNIRSGEMFRFQLHDFPKCTLANDIGKLLLPQLKFSTDITFFVGIQKIPVLAHCSIIAARCQWLKEKIISAKSEKTNKDPSVTTSNNNSLIIEIPDADVSAFNLVLEYLYTDKIDFSPSSSNTTPALAFSNEVVLNTMRVYTLALSFHLTLLERLSLRYLETSVNLNNVLFALTNASSLKLQPIKEYCLRFIVKETNYKQIVMSENFESLAQPLMIEVIRRREQFQSKDGIAVGNNNEPIKRPPQMPKEPKLSALKEDLQRFLLTTGKDFADIELKIEDSLVPAHKAILCARSSYFEGMFRSFKKLNNDPVPISIGEMIPSKQSFHSLMRFIYYGDVGMPPEDSLYLFTAHAFYIFTNNRLQVFCKHNLERNVSSENVVQILEAADKSQTHCQTNDMKRYALNLIVKNFHKVVHLPQVKDLKRELLLDILYAMAEQDETSNIPDDKRKAEKLVQDLSFASFQD